MFCISSIEQQLYVCEAIVHFCIENDHSLKVKDAENLAKQIAEVFDGEESVSVFDVIYMCMRYALIHTYINIFFYCF